MQHSDFATPVDLAAITEAIDACCAARDIKEVSEREQVALRALNIFQSGVSSAEEIEARLAENVGILTR